jgi:ABC-type multidrug transport system ATPase subunit
VSADPLAIECRGLRHRFDDVQVLDGVTFEVAAGEVFGLLGPNGTGNHVSASLLGRLGR